MIATMQDARRVSNLPLAKDGATGKFSGMSVPVCYNSKFYRMSLAEAVAMADPPVAGRAWSGGVPTGYRYGNLYALWELPERLGLGRYLVTDDRQRRKLHPEDSTRYADGSPAKLDGSEGQCMWCWNAHYYTTWNEAGYEIEVVTFYPVPGKKSYYIPAGGISWFKAGVVDREDLKLCSLISDDERYRGGKGLAIPDGNYPYLPGGNIPQRTQLGMAATGLTAAQFSGYARSRGEGWEACWYVARAVVCYLIRIILGSRYSLYGNYPPVFDADGLYHDSSVGPGVNIMWYNNYNGCYPIIPTSVGLEEGDKTGIIDYHLPFVVDGSEVINNQRVPVFFGLVNPYHHLGTIPGGLLVESGTSKVYAHVAPSMYDTPNYTSVAGKLRAAELVVANGYEVKQVSMNLLCAMPVSTVDNLGALEGSFISTGKGILPCVTGSHMLARSC